MKKKRFTEQQIIGFLKEAEAGMPVKELCRKHGFSDAAFYGWRSKFGGLQVSEAKRLRELQVENAKLKKLLAEAHVDVEALKVAFGVKRSPRPRSRSLNFCTLPFSVREFRHEIDEPRNRETTALGDVARVKPSSLEVYLRGRRAAARNFAEVLRIRKAA